MSKKSKNLWYLIGMTACFASVIIGIVFLNKTVNTLGVLEGITFGADFYTEIYKSNRAIWTRLGQIVSFAEIFKDIFGSAFILSGVVGFCCFGSKIELNNGTENDNTEVDEELPEL